jgi:hypothetical protein
MSETIKIRVSARPEKGFYRAGRFWTSAPTDAEVTKAELVILKAETNLVVVELGEDGEDPSTALETANTDLTKKISDLEAKVKELEGKNGELERDLAGTVEGKTTLETANTDLTKKISDLEAKVKELEKKPK